MKTASGPLNVEDSINPYADDSEKPSDEDGNEDSDDKDNKDKTDDDDDTKDDSGAASIGAIALSGLMLASFAF